MLRSLFLGVGLTFLLGSCSPSADPSASGEASPGPAAAGAPPADAPPGPPAGARNLLLITLDTLRWDHVGCYGYFRDTTPAIDALARESLQFLHCLAPIAHTTPSHASLLTGVYPFEHGILSNSVLKSDDVQRQNAFHATARLRSFAQVAAARGYRTGGFVSATPVKQITGLSTGFEVWTQPEAHRRPAREACRDLQAFWEESGDRPWFAWIHLFDAHGPFDADHPPAEYVSRYTTDAALEAHLTERAFSEEVSGKHVEGSSAAEVVNQYDGAVRYLDDQLGEMLAALRASDQWARTAVVLTGDHGQGLGQHDMIAHGVVWVEQLRVPCLMRVPGVPPGPVDVTLSTIDVLPTALAMLPELADDEYLAQCRGTDVRAADFEPRPVFGMSPPRRGLLGLTSGRWKYIRGEDGPLLFDLETDPHELTNLAATRSDVAKRLGEALDRLVLDQRRRGEQLREGAPTEDPTQLDPEYLKELQSLGYAIGDEDPLEDG